VSAQSYRKGVVVGGAIAVLWHYRPYRIGSGWVGEGVGVGKEEERSGMRSGARTHTLPPIPLSLPLPAGHQSILASWELDLHLLATALFRPLAHQHTGPLAYDCSPRPLPILSSQLGWRQCCCKNKFRVCFFAFLLLYFLFFAPNRGDNGGGGGGEAKNLTE